MLGQFMQPLPLGYTSTMLSRKRPFLSRHRAYEGEAGATR